MTRQERLEAKVALTATITYLRRCQAARVRLGQLGEWRKLILARLPGRIMMPEEERR